MYPTVATTKLANIVANAQAVRGLVGERKILAAVKGDAYGHGAVPVAKALEPVVDWFGVATVEEGATLRAGGVRRPILKLSGPANDDDIELALSQDVTLTVTGLEQALAVARLASRPVPVHLKIDTGMGRIGCPSTEALAVARAIVSEPWLRLEGVFSHLPVSDQPGGTEFTKAQIEVFAQLVAAIRSDCGPVLAHLANSGAILQHPESYFDLVRPGIMLYGSYPDVNCPQTVALRPGLDWTTTVSFVKRVPAGATISYGQTWAAPTERWIATLPVGYADGLPRHLSNRGRVLIAGQSYPIVGVVCMDQTMIDCGPVRGPQPPVTVGEACVLIGGSGSERITATEMAVAAGTIPYELTCQITGRVRREFS